MGVHAQLQGQVVIPPLLGGGVLQCLLLGTGEGVVGPRHIPDEVLRQVEVLFEEAVPGGCTLRQRVPERHQAAQPLPPVFAKVHLAQDSLFGLV